MKKKIFAGSAMTLSILGLAFGTNASTTSNLISGSSLEPAVMLLVGIGLAGLAGFKRFKK